MPIPKPTGLCWKNAPDGKILKSDVAPAKNYLGETHIKELNRIVAAYLDLAENRAERRIAMTMKDWGEFLRTSSSSPTT